MVDQALGRFGRIDFLMNNAGIVQWGAAEDVTEAEWRDVLDVNLTGVFLMTQSVGRVMRAQNSGVIINLITGSAHDKNAEAAFIASMNGLDGLTRQAAREFAPYGIKVYSVENIQEKIVERVFALLDLRKEE